MKRNARAQTDRQTDRHGFTLIELLVVIAILALLVSLLMPAMSHARILAKKAACQMNYRNIGQQFQIYGANHNDAFTGPFSPLSAAAVVNGYHGYDVKTYVTLLLDQVIPSHGYPTWQHVHNMKGNGPNPPWPDYTTALAQYENYKRVAAMFFCPISPLARVNPQTASWNGPAALEAEVTSYHWVAQTWMWAADRPPPPATAPDTYMHTSRLNLLPQASSSVMLGESQYHLWPDFATPVNAPYLGGPKPDNSIVGRSYYHHGAKDINFLYFDGHVDARIAPPYILSGGEASPGWTHYETFVGRRAPWRRL